MLICSTCNTLGKHPVATGFIFECSRPIISSTDYISNNRHQNEYCSFPHSRWKYLLQIEMNYYANFPCLTITSDNRADYFVVIRTVKTADMSCQCHVLLSDNGIFQSLWIFSNEIVTYSINMKKGVFNSNQHTIFIVIYLRNLSEISSTKKTKLGGLTNK